MTVQQLKSGAIPDLIRGKLARTYLELYRVLGERFVRHLYRMLLGPADECVHTGLIF